MSGQSFRTIAALAMGLHLLVPAEAISQSPASREYQVKAAFIYNFVQFVGWPADAFEDDQEPIRLAVLGKDPFGDTLERAVAGKRVGNRSIVVRNYSTLDELQRCHVLFVSDSESEQLTHIFERIGEAPVLTIGETDQFPWAGGIIRFLVEDNKIRFEINLAAAERAKLQINAKLLKLAKIFKR